MFEPLLNLCKIDIDARPGDAREFGSRRKLRRIGGLRNGKALFQHAFDPKLDGFLWGGARFSDLLTEGLVG